MDDNKILWQLCLYFILLIIAFYSLWQNTIKNIINYNEFWFLEVLMKLNDMISKEFRKSFL